MKENVVITEEHHFRQQHTQLYPTSVLSRLTPCAEEITEDHLRGFRRNMPTNGHIRVLCIRHILMKKWEYNEAVHQLFMGFKTAYDLVRREAVCNILFESGIPIRLRS